MKVAFDENVPVALVRVFRALAGEPQVEKLGLIFESAKDYTPTPSDSDYRRKDDAPWIRRFASAGGQVIISGNTKMMRMPHERLAMLNEGMIVLFPENRWNNWRFFTKCALLLLWLPSIAEHLKNASPKTFWRIPSTWIEKGDLRELSTDDPRLLRLERKTLAKKEKKALIKQKMKKHTFAQTSLLDLLRPQSDAENEAKKP